MDGCVVERRRGGAGVDSFEKHGAAVLVEEFRSRVDVVVCAGVGSADDHHGISLCGGGGWVVDAVVVNGWLEEVSVFGEPVVLCKGILRVSYYIWGLASFFSVSLIFVISPTLFFYAFCFSFLWVEYENAGIYVW